jgi:hypothetical protein
MALLGKFESKDVAGEVMCLVALTKCLVEPLQALNELQSRAESASLSAGDVQYACLSRFMCCSNKFWSGVNLADVNQEVSQAELFVKKQDCKVVLDILMTFQLAVSILVGNKAENEFDLGTSEQRRTTPRNMLNW